MSFRLVPGSVTLNDLEQRNGVILRYFSEFGQLPGALRKTSRSLSHLLMSNSCLQYKVHRTVLTSHTSETSIVGVSSQFQTTHLTSTAFIDYINDQPYEQRMSLRQQLIEQCSNLYVSKPTNKRSLPSFKIEKVKRSTSFYSWLPT